MRRFVIASLIVTLVSCGIAAQAGKPKYATGFSWETDGPITIVTVARPWRGAGPSASRKYLLYPRGSAPSSRRMPDTTYVPVPLKSAVTFNAAYAAAIELLGEAASVKGVDSGSYLYSSTLRSALDKGSIREVSKDFSPNIEVLLSIAPEAVFVYGVGNEWDVAPRLEKAGLPVVVCAEWMEEDPLARAEWLKFFGLFYGKKKEAERRFAQIEDAYMKVRAAAGKATGTRPKVLANAPFQGSWTVPGGASYMSKLIADAGGYYLWADDPSPGGLSLSLEAVYERAVGADVWLNPGTIPNRAALSALDPRFSGIKALKSGAVWINDRRSLPSGANDWYEGAVFRPDLVLADLRAIMSGKADPAALNYFRPLP